MVLLVVEPGIVVVMVVVVQVLVLVREQVVTTV